CCARPHEGDNESFTRSLIERHLIDASECTNEINLHCGDRREIEERNRNGACCDGVEHVIVDEVIGHRQFPPPSTSVQGAVCGSAAPSPSFCPRSGWRDRSS